jgi:hypothetical protein
MNNDRDGEDPASITKSILGCTVKLRFVSTEKTNAIVLSQKILSDSFKANYLGENHLEILDKLLTRMG